jgi:hypothetical protein
MGVTSRRLPAAILAWCLAVGSTSAGPPKAPEIRTDPVVTRIHGVPLAIPRNHFIYPPSGKDENDALIQALLPDMAGATPENRQEFWSIGGGQRRKLMMLLAAIEMVDLRGYMRTYAPGAEPTRDRPMVHGLHHVESYATRRLVDVFYELADGEPTFVIQCDGVGAVPYPGCSTLIRFEGIPVQIRFDRRHLPEWRSVELKVRALLQSFKDAAKPRNDRP